MTTREKQQYYDESRSREIRQDLKTAITLIDQNLERVAVDCGCGAGVDIAFLRAAGFKVHAFDIEAEAIERCRYRFGADPDVILTQADFEGFNYPKASLVSADAALFFCPVSGFEQVWQRITDCLPPGGVFCGSFLGPDDTMASDDYNREAFWPDILTFTESALKPRFDAFDIRLWNEHRISGESQGKAHNWHIFSVVAVKQIQ